MNQLGLQSCNRDEALFPSEGSPAAQLRYLVRYAILAPSIHNSQPWCFALRGGALELYADHTRALPVADPEHREMIMSCGAALFNLAIAMRHFGYQPLVREFPAPDIPNLLATIRLGQREAPTPEEDLLFQAIPGRHTNRLPYEERSIPKALIAALRDAATSERSWLYFVEDEPIREVLFALIAEGDRRQYVDLHFRQELASWVHPYRSVRRDGMPDYAFQMGGLLSYAGPSAGGAVDDGEGVAGSYPRAAVGSPVVAVLGTPGDSPKHWLRVGKALERVLLLADANGVSASFLNQPIEQPSLRRRLCRAMGTRGYPQMLIRMGYGPEVQATPRRPVREILSD
jgi:nitroreductase